MPWNRTDDRQTDHITAILLDQTRELRSVSHAIGGMQQQLRSGHEIHLELREKVGDLHDRLTIVEADKAEDTLSERLSSLATFLGLIKDYWPWLLAGLTAGAKLAGLKLSLL